MTHHLTTVEHVEEAMHGCITTCPECHDVCLAAVQGCAESCRGMAA